MARQITEEVAELVKSLITQMSGLEEGTEAFNHIRKRILATLKKSDTMYFLNKREVDENIASMAEKFIFHGLSPQAKALQYSYKDYIPENLSEFEQVSRLNVVKVLLCLSERPTSNLLENPEEFKSEKADEEEEDINWGEYLKEGIERWTPNLDETSEYSDESCSKDDTYVDGNRSGCNASLVPVIIDGTEKNTVVDFRTSREELLATIQHTWFNQERFYMPPCSNWREANIGILWDKYLEDQVMGLIPIERTSVLSEYKVIREVLWQMWSQHTSAVFELQRNTLRPKSGVTISSVRAETFESFLKQFIPYMEVLEFFREFSDYMTIKNDECISAVPCTYRSYNNSLQKIIRPIYKKLSELEDKVREQETTYTLLKLAHDLQPLMEPVAVLKKIHDEAVLDFNENSPLRCATVLLCNLHNSLQYSGTKLEQDLRVTLFLDSLYHYFTRIDWWLMKNDLSDYSGEFVIINKNKHLYESDDFTGDLDESVADSEKWMLNFDVRGDLDDICENDGIIKIIRENVLQIGRNLHLLRLLGKFSLITDCKETIHEEFVGKCLEELEKFYRAESGDSAGGDETGETFFDCVEETARYKYPVVCTEEFHRPTEFDKLENLVDTTDGFLMLAFEDYFVEKKAAAPAREEETLFEKVSKITTTMFPTGNFFERIFAGLLRERFTISGLMVKNVLIDEYSLEKQFQFLRHVFLFCDDLTFPFYRRLFEKVNAAQKNAASAVWMTSHLQDVLADPYPEFGRRCRVQARNGFRHCVDPLDVCSAVQVQFEVRWPLDIVISSAHMELYRDMFTFVMQIKWALYTTNRLAFTSLEPKGEVEGRPRGRRNAVVRLKCLRFSLTNLLSSVQHYVFSFVVTKSLQTFELEFEKARDLSLIIASHSQFINAVYGMSMDVRQSERDFPAFKNVIQCVKLLKLMWDDVELATRDRLDECYGIYRKCYEAIDPIVCPVYIFDY